MEILFFGNLFAFWRFGATRIFGATRRFGFGDLMVFGDLLAPWRLVALQIATKQSILQIFKAISELGGAQIL